MKIDLFVLLKVLLVIGAGLTIIMYAADINKKIKNFYLTNPRRGRRKSTQAMLQTGFVKAFGFVVFGLGLLALLSMLRQ